MSQSKTSYIPAYLFAKDKHSFFHSDKPDTANRAEALNKARERARNHDYFFLAKTHLTAEEEFRNLLGVLQSDYGRKDQWLYCYYCCIMLATYYDKEHYNSPAQAQSYLDLAKDIEHCFMHDTKPETVKTWQAKLADDLKDLLSTPWHLSKLRAWVGLSNIYRIVLTFSRLTAQQFFAILQQKQILSVLSSILHIPLNLDDLNRNINRPTHTFWALSVGLFLTRLAINLYLLLAHTFAPTKGEKTVSMSMRFYHELQKRYATMLNDIVWAIINGLTNYASFFKISAPVANGLLFTFLLFDVTLLAWRLHEAEHHYTMERTRYRQEKQEAQTRMAQLIEENASPDQLKAQQAMLDTIDEQLAELDIQRQAKRAEFGANLTAGSLLALGFSASVLIAAPAAVLASYFIIVVGSALYLSAGAYGVYEQNRLRRQQKADLNQDTKQASVDEKKSLHAFLGLLVQNTAMPILIMGALAISWQAALLLVVLSIGYTQYKNYASMPKPTPPKAATSEIPTQPETQGQSEDAAYEAEAPNMAPSF